MFLLLAMRKDVDDMFSMQSLVVVGNLEHIKKFVFVFRTKSNIFGTPVNNYLC